MRGGIKSKKLSTENGGEAFFWGGKKGRTEKNFSAAACLQGRASSQAKSSATALKSASEQGPAALFHPALVPHLSPHPNTTLPKFPKRGILKTYKKLLELPSQFEKVHKVLDENYFWKIFRIKKRKARNTPPVRACFQIFITNDFIKF